MSAYKDFLHIEIDSSKGRIDLAMQLLRRSEGTVVLAKQIALRPEPDRILCEVIEGPHDPRRSPEEYASLVETAGEYLKASPLGDAIAKRTLEWVVVSDQGTRTVELWHGARP